MTLKTAYTNLELAIAQLTSAHQAYVLKKKEADIARATFEAAREKYLTAKGALDEAVRRATSDTGA